MEKRAEPLEIKTTTGGMIDLIQERGFHDDEAVVVIRIHPDQVEQVIQWLHEAKTELKGSRATLEW